MIGLFFHLQRCLFDTLRFLRNSSWFSNIEEQNARCSYLVIMDSRPLSNILASVFTLTAFCGDRIRAIIDISKYGPVSVEFSALSNEVNDLRIVLTEVEANHTDFPILHLLERAHSILLEIDKLISSSFKLGENNDILLQKNTWLRKKSLSTTVMHSLREIR